MRAMTSGDEGGHHSGRGGADGSCLSPSSSTSPAAHHNNNGYGSNRSVIRSLHNTLKTSRKRLSAHLAAASSASCLLAPPSSAPAARPLCAPPTWEAFESELSMLRQRIKQFETSTPSSAHPSSASPSSPSSSPPPAVDYDKLAAAISAIPVNHPTTTRSSSPTYLSSSSSSIYSSPEAAGVVVKVCQGSKCQRKGSQAVMEAACQAIAATASSSSSSSSAEVVSSKCLGLCGQAPAIQVLSPPLQPAPSSSHQEGGTTGGGVDPITVTVSSSSKPRRRDLTRLSPEDVAPLLSSVLGGAGSA